MIDRLPLDKFLAQFDETIHAKLRAMLSRDGVSGLVMLQNQTFDSSQLGKQSALAVGPGCTYKDPESVERIGDVPSRHQYPINAYVKGA